MTDLYWQMLIEQLDVTETMIFIIGTSLWLGGVLTIIFGLVDDKIFKKWPLLLIIPGAIMFWAVYFAPGSCLTMKMAYPNAQSVIKNVCGNN